MMPEKTIRTFIPFFIVIITTFFMSGANPFQTFPSLGSIVGQDEKLLTLLLGSFVFLGTVSLAISLVFFKAWRKLSDRKVWYLDLMWQISGMFFCFFLLCAILVWGVFQRFLWIQGMAFMFVAIFGLYFFNTVFAARKLLYNPPTPQESIEKARKLDEVIKFLSNEQGDMGPIS